MKLLIGLTPIVDAGRDSLWMLPGYMQGLEAVGGIGMMLPLTDDAAMLKDLVDRGRPFADRRQRCGTGAVR